MIIKADISQVLGLLDLLKSYDGKTDIATLTSKLMMDIEDLFPIIDTAEYLGLVTVINGDVQLTDIGYKLSESKLLEQKKIIKNQIISLEPFASIMKYLHEKGELNEEELKGILSSKVDRGEDFESFLKSVIAWGSFSKIFHYNGGSKKIYLKRKSK